MPTSILSKWQNSDTFFRIKPIRRLSPNCFLPKIFRFNGIWRAVLSMNFKTIVTCAWEMLKQMFLHIWLRALKFCVNTFEVIPTISKGINSLSNILLQTFFCKSVNKLDMSRYTVRFPALAFALRTFRETYFTHFFFTKL